MKIRGAVLACLVLSACGPRHGAPGEWSVERFAYEEATIGDLQAAMTAGRTTSEALVEAYLDRIEALDKEGPELHAMIAVNPEAREIARALDDERRAKGPRGPLHGIPVVVKDNVDTGDRMPTTAGSLALAGVTRERDAFIVERLRAAGAVILGKTNLSEWANIRSTRSSSGWSAVGGQARNPYVLDRSPCGSSSGTGAAIAASYAAAGVGTETDGSITCPSSVNGLVGIKPTVGLVSRSGIVPISHTQDTPGPMARTVTDAAILLGAMTGVDARDAATAGAKAEKDYTPFLKKDSLRGARIGVARHLAGYHEEVDALFEAALAEMRHQGAVLVDPVELPNQKELDNAELEVLLYELKADLDAYLKALPPQTPVHSLADVIAFNEKNRDTEMPFFGQELFLKAQAKGPLSDDAYVKALAACRTGSRENGIDAVMDANKLDAIVAPSFAPAWSIDVVCGDHFLGGSSSPAAISGYPAITVPAGLVHGLPVGITLFGRAWSEPTLIGYGFAFEQATNARRPPRFLRTVDTSPSSP